MHTRIRKSLLLSLACLITLAGCSSISKGVAEAVLEQKKEDTRKCNIVAEPITGIRASLDSQAQDHHLTKMLIVHGISSHLPGYSTRFQENITESLKLNMVDKKIKEITLADRGMIRKDGTFEPLGTLEITRYRNRDESKQLLFYELTWSSITEPQKRSIAFDNSDAYEFRRAQLNGILKGFVNETVPDMLIYMGNRNQQIDRAVSQSICWMFHGGWDDLPEKSHDACDTTIVGKYQSVDRDDFYFLTHSLGSRITIDTINHFAERTNSPSASGQFQTLVKDLQHKEFTVFMLANQLPLLQMGRPEPSVVGKIPEYCTRGGALAQDRLLGRTRLIAFSDPNDILSYPIPPHYADEHIDSRACPDVSNVMLNVAKVNDVFGATEFADPLSAHSDYENDDRVIGLITDGISRTNMAPAVAERCRWTEVTP